MKSQLSEDGVSRMFRALPKVYLSEEEAKKLHLRTFRKLQTEKFKKKLVKVVNFFVQYLVEIILAIVIMVLLFQLK